MPHFDPEDLALMSLGESVGTPGMDAHLATCQECQDELNSLSRLVGASRSGGPVHLEQPSPDVWSRIYAELDLDLDTPQVGSRSAAPAAGLTEADPNEVEQGRTDDQAIAPVVSLDDRRRRPATWLLAAAGIGGIVVGGLATAAVVNSPEQESLTVAASVDLAPLPAWNTQGTAQLAVNDAGQQVLVVSLDADEAAESNGFQEVWLIDENVEGMVSLGILDGTSGQFVIPAGVDVSAFPIVDVSLEPFDGDPTHSGDSITRGQIEA